MIQRHKLGLALLLLLSFLILTPAEVLASPLLSQFGGQAANVPAGHTVETVVAVSTDAHISGRVSDVILVINGNVYLEPSAQVELVIDLGGHVYNSSHRTARQGILELNFTQSFVNDLFVTVSVLFGLWFFRVMLSLLSIVLLTGLGYVLRNRLSPSVQLLASTPSRLFGIGIAASLIIIALTVLLTLTIIGIPLAVFIVLICLIACLAGVLPIITYLSSLVLSQRVQEYPGLTRWLISAILFVALANLPLVGLIFLLGTGATALGLALTQGWLKFKLHRAESVQK